MGVYEKFSHILYLLILIDCGLLIVSTIYDINTNYLYLFSLIDLVTCIIIFADFIYRAYNSEDKKEFLKHNWIDLIAAIPINLFLLRALRFIKLIKLLKLFVMIRRLCQKL